MYPMKLLLKCDIKVRQEKKRGSWDADHVQHSAIKDSCYQLVQHKMYSRTTYIMQRICSTVNAIGKQTGDPWKKQHRRISIYASKFQLSQVNLAFQLISPSKHKQLC